MYTCNNTHDFAQFRAEVGVKEPQLLGNRANWLSVREVLAESGSEDLASLDVIVERAIVGDMNNIVLGLLRMNPRTKVSDAEPMYP